MKENKKTQLESLISDGLKYEEIEKNKGCREKGIN